MRAATWGVSALLAIAFLGSDEDGMGWTFPQLLALAVLPPLAASWVEGMFRVRVAEEERKTHLHAVAMKHMLEGDSEGSDDAESDA